tara:strand:- start:258 stop:467 length:210 start_codon:yes stop_codon:yes gene_type:complete
VGFNNYTKKKVNYNNYKPVFRADAELVSLKVVKCIEDEELREFVAGLLSREYLTDRELFIKHKERYHDV